VIVGVSRRPGWRAILADTATRLEPGGDQTFEAAKAEALRHLEERLTALRPDMPATRRAGLRLALLRLLQARETP
jgi:hypothetical protein